MDGSCGKTPLILVSGKITFVFPCGIIILHNINSTPIHATGQLLCLLLCNAGFDFNNCCTWFSQCGQNSNHFAHPAVDRLSDKLDHIFQHLNQLHQQLHTIFFASKLQMLEQMTWKLLFPCGLLIHFHCNFFWLNHLPHKINLTVQNLYSISSKPRHTHRSFLPPKCPIPWSFSVP